MPNRVSVALAAYPTCWRVSLCGSQHVLVLALTSQCCVQRSVAWPVPAPGARARVSVGVVCVEVCGH